MTVSTTSTICIKYYFNSHPHEEDDIGSCPICIATRIFQLTSSRRGWPVSLILHHAHTIFQLTSSRRGWHWPDTNTFRTGISTHILTKRMTWRYKRASDHRSISTHILTKRMTIQTDSSMPSWINFNSHPHEEDDLVYPVQFHFNNISTHILTKRMTFTRQMLSNTVKFQLTSSRRGWRVITASKMWKQYFNSHPHEEDDGTMSLLAQLRDISTHILTKRMTSFRQPTSHN